MNRARGGYQSLVVRLDLGVHSAERKEKEPETTT